MKWSLPCLVFGLAAATAAVAQDADPADLPPRDVVARWLATDPAVREAGAAVDVAQRDAAMLRTSPNEWTINATAQRRRYDDADPSREWNVGIERTLRLPGKRRLDGDLGDRGLAIARARFDAAARQALVDLSELWLDWIAAEQIAALAVQQSELVEANRASVEKRVKAGDASKLDLNLAAAERDEAERLHAEARADADVARARLDARFPDVPASVPTLSEPPVEEEDARGRVARWLDESPALRIARARLDEAEAAVERERADRIPDPTLGVFNGSEAHSRERIVGLSVSIPLPGRYRGEKLARSLAQRDAHEAALAGETQRARADAAVLATADESGARRWHLARAASARAQENARLTQRGYALGEIDLQTLLLARRQALEAERTRIATQVAALRAHYRWAIDIGVLWADLRG